MKYNYLSIRIILLSLTLLTIACRGKEKPQEEPERINLDLSSVTVFSKQIENTIQLSNPNFLNNAFHKAAIKDSISDNSILYSSFDTDFGRGFFESNFQLGDEVIKILDRGGDYKIVRCYEKDGKFHIVSRIYCDFSIRIDDYIVDTVDNQIKIVDGFNYNYATTFSNLVKYNMLFGILDRTNPIGNTAFLIESSELLKNGQPKAARKILDEQQSLLKEYPSYWQLYIQSVYESDKKQYLALLDKLEKEEHFDARSILLHRLFFYTHQGMPQQVEETVNNLIEYTGDDPIYLYFFGLANYNAGDYDKALYAYENVTTGMPIIWDLWCGILQCQHKLALNEEFQTTLEIGKELYGMTDEELHEMKLEMRNKK